VRPWPARRSGVALGWRRFADLVGVRRQSSQPVDQHIELEDQALDPLSRGLQIHRKSALQ